MCTDGMRTMKNETIKNFVGNTCGYIFHLSDTKCWKMMLKRVNSPNECVCVCVNEYIPVG